MKKIALFILFFLVIFTVSACKDSVYTVTFINDEEEVIETLSVSSLKDAEFPELTKERYEFAGWQTADEVIVNQAYELKRDITLYPKWDDVIITVHYLDDTTYDMNMTLEDSSETVTSWYYPGDQIGFFLGYYDENDVRFDQDYPLTQSADIYPKFTTIEESLIGESFGDDFFGLEGFLSEYYFNTNQLKDEHGNIITNPNAVDPYEPFESYLEEIGEENFTEEKFIEFFAQELVDHNPSYYRNIETDEMILASEMDLTNLSEIKYYAPASYFVNQNDEFFARAYDITQESYVYAKVDIITKEIDMSVTLLTDDTLTPIRLTGKLVRTSNAYYIEYTKDRLTRFINIETKQVETNLMIFANVYLRGLLYTDGQNLYDFFEPMTYHKNSYVQFESTPFIDQVRQYVYNTYSRAFFNKTDDSFYRLLNLVLLKAYPEMFITLPYGQGLDYHQSMEDMFTGDIPYTLQGNEVYMFFSLLGTIPLDE